MINPLPWKLDEHDPSIIYDANGDVNNKIYIEKLNNILKYYLENGKKLSKFILNKFCKEFYYSGECPYCKELTMLISKLIEELEYAKKYV